MPFTSLPDLKRFPSSKKEGHIPAQINTTFFSQIDEWFSLILLSMMMLYGMEYLPG